jgi:hypothetical protein
MTLINSDDVIGFIEQIQVAQDLTLADTLDQGDIPADQARIYYQVGKPILTMIHAYVTSLASGAPSVQAMLAGLGVAVEESKRDGILDPDFEPPNPEDFEL